MRRGGVSFYPWGLLVKVSSTKTIQYGQRLVELPIAVAPGSPLCATFWLQQHLHDFPTCQGDMNLFVLQQGTVVRNMTYACLLGFFKNLQTKACKYGKNTGLHSLRRAGAAYMHFVGLTLEDVRQAGDWNSMAALLYLAKPLESRIRLDQRVANSLSFIKSN